METKVNVRIKRGIEEVLLSHGYLCEIQSSNIILVGLKNIEAKLIIIEQEGKIYFQLDVLSIDELTESNELYKELLHLNYDIVPLSIAIDKSEENNHVLILTTALEAENLDENELIKIVHSFEEAIEDLIMLLKNYFIDGLELREGEISGLY